MKKSSSDACDTRKRAAQYALSGMLEYDDLSSQSSVVSETALIRKEEQIERARKSMLRKTEDTENHGMFWWITCGDIK